MSLMEMLAQRMHDNDDEKVVQNIEEQKRLLALLHVKHEFKAGDVVVWKKGLKDRKFPDYDEPALITEVMDPPIFDNERDTGEPYFMIPLSIKIGRTIPGRGFCEYCLDGRRFEPYKE